MEFNKRIVISIMLVILIFTFVGCKEETDFAAKEEVSFTVVGSNLANYQETGVEADTKELNVKFNQQLAEVEVSLLKNGEQVTGFKTNIDKQQLSITSLKLVPITNYKLVIVAKSDSGQEITNSYQFETKPASYPQVENPNETLLQGFYWEMAGYPYLDKYPEEKNLWELLAKRAPKFKELGFTSIWIPPANKADSVRDEGYAVYDLWDLGEFKQAGSVRTKYGTKEELETAVAALHEQNIKVYYDAVLNHRIGLGKQNVESTVLKSGKEIKSYTSFPNLKGREKYYSQAEKWDWNWKQFDGVDYDAEDGPISPQAFKDKTWDDTYDKDYLLGADVDYENKKVQHELKEWGAWLVNDIGFDGFRIDAVKHIDSNFIDQWLTHIQKNSEKDVFFVGEAWIKNKMGLSFFLSDVDNKDLTVFDFPLRNTFKDMMTGLVNMSALGSAGLVNDPNYSDRAITFIDNHDTGRDKVEYNAPITRFKMQAYAYILTRAQGKPMVFWKDYYQNGYQSELHKLLEVRKYYAYGPGREVNNNSKRVYSYVREGLESKPRTGLVAMISSGTSGEVVSKRIKTNKPNTTFYDYTRNIKETVTTDENGYAEFKIRLSEKTGWSIWVPSSK
ncbi:alpha-amylase domain-containing protein [Halanaerobacter jeridensis]|uniref:Alpha-amylase n=1 Tax=Halanaerobacter jeridensis TaxID=706427 RepID=A0A939BT15_9FIRM|nr:alpha-amylase domain-containing protein [Halanaerobacter jeridensis]MBM7557751.1 alpha-amylase [Halanaerobacter jeridensis]